MMASNIVNDEHTKTELKPSSYVNLENGKIHLIIKNTHCKMCQRVFKCQQSLEKHVAKCRHNKNEGKSFFNVDKNISSSRVRKKDYDDTQKVALPESPLSTTQNHTNNSPLLVSGIARIRPEGEKSFDDPIRRIEEIETIVKEQIPPAQYADQNKSAQVESEIQPCRKNVTSSSMSAGNSKTIDNDSGETASSIFEEITQTTLESKKCKANLPKYDILPKHLKTEKSFRSMTYRDFFQKIDEIYNEIVFFRRNIFNVPSGHAGKEYVKELVFWLKQFNANSDLNYVAIKAFMILPTIILQKPSAKSKAKDHTKALERRLQMWRNGEMDALMTEVRFIQNSFKRSTKPKDIEEISRIFSKLVLQGKLTAALKFLDKESNSGVLNLSSSVLNDLRDKHPPEAPILEGSLLNGPIKNVPPNIFDIVDEQLIFKTSMRTKGSSGPSGMDADAYRRILCSKNFKTVGKELREEIAIMTRNLLTTNYHHSLIESYIACRLIPLNKNPGVRPIGVGEVLRRIIGKSISWILKEEISEAAGPLQTCAGHTAGAEAAIHGMRSIFEEEETDAVLLIDASNAFNQMNRQVGMHNIRIICPEVSLYIINTYRHPSRLFINGEEEILSEEGTTQGDPLAMPWYAMNTRPLIDRLRILEPEIKQAWLADDSAGGGKLQNLCAWFKHLCTEGKKLGYHVNGSKSWLIVKSTDKRKEAEELFGKSVKITTEGKRHLGAVIGSKEYKDQYCKSIVDVWKGELETLTEIAKNEPQAAYIALTKAYKSKFMYFMRTIDSFDEYVSPIDDLLKESFIPTIFDSEIPMEDHFMDLFSLSPNLGGLGIPCLRRDSAPQFEASKEITETHVKSILKQTTLMEKPDIPIEAVKAKHREKKERMVKTLMSEIDDTLQPDTQRQVEQTRDKGASSWLNAIPFEDQGFKLNKQEFRDSIRIRYHLKLKDLPSKCVCDHPFTVDHALICKKGGFISQRHDNIRNILTSSLGKICKNVEMEPRLLPLDNEKFSLRSANTSEEARLDIKAGGFWSKGVTAFFDVRVTHVNSQSNQNQSTEKIFKRQEAEKKRSYNERIIEVEKGTFTPLVFGTNGGMGEECVKFIKKLSEELSIKLDESYANTITWLRTKLSFAIIKSVHMCVRGSRRPFKNDRPKEVLEDFRLNNTLAGL